MKRLCLIALTGVLAAGACGSSTLGPKLQPSTVTFQLRNDGASTVYLFENCTIEYTITSLADPVHAIARQGTCACACDQSSCPVCGPCFAGPRDVAVGAMLAESWNSVSVTTEPTPAGSCERATPLPYGRYRIDVPVYPTAADALARMYGRTITQTFDLPVAGDAVDVQLGVSL
jgi:hypothetical protein